MTPATWRRSMGRESTGRRGAACALGLLLSTALVAGCSGVPVTPAGPSPSGTGPSSASPSASPSESPPPAHEASVELFFAISQPASIDLIGEVRTIEYDGALLEGVIRTITEGEVRGADPDYDNLWNDVPLHGLSVEGDVLVVDLGSRLSGVGAEAEQVAIDQLVWTATGIDPSIRALSFTVDGAPVDTLAGHIDARGEFVRGSEAETLSPVQIDSPAEGETVVGAIVAQGRACVFEATFAWELISSGTVVDQGSGMSAESCPVRSPWTVELGARPPGEYTLVVTEISMKDGSAASVDTATFTVSGR
ncbi:GerMN domain-containing protein [Microcella daejeonensis]|uniref:GerMN domain-containing protein n=1 Tax=Microcella daejeonensis TaxID=2994971 RepID=A0A9E8MJB2_9MICO|nr:Gmad2 immunoglobulin-like domain-containing protein [Microcella daejeonensis]WAB80620.1 GerMN domain-containing protein [Microcella daejeonensis]